MKAMKKVLALGLALAMVVTAVPVTNAQAATTVLPKTKKYAAGMSYTLKLTAPSTWSKVSTKWTSSKTSVAKVSNQKAKSVKVTAVKKGTATVTAKVTYTKNKKKKTKSWKCKVTVKNPGISFTDNTNLVVGDKVQILKKTFPASGVTMAYTSSDDTVATVDANGEVTAVKAGKATITAHMTGGNSIDHTKSVEVTVKSTLSVKQTASNAFVATVSGDVKDYTKDSFTVAAVDGTSVLSVKSVEPVTGDSNSVLVTLYTNFVDGKLYKVTCGESDFEFTAKVGAPAKIELVTKYAVQNTKTPIEFKLYDADGIDVTANVNRNTTCIISIDDSFTGSYDISRAENASITMNQLGQKVKVKIRYNDGVSGMADVEGEGEIECTAANLNNSTKLFAVFTQRGLNYLSKCERFYLGSSSDEVAVTEGSEKVVYFCGKDADGNVVSFDSYEIESSNDDVVSAVVDATVNGGGSDHGKFVTFKVYGHTAGTATLNVTAIKNDLRTPYTIPVKVSKVESAVRMTVTVSDPVMSNVKDEDYFGKIYATLYDKNNKEVETKDFSYENITLVNPGDTNLTVEKNGTYSAANAKARTYTIQVKGLDTVSGATFTQNVGVTVRELPADAYVKTKGVNLTYHVEFNELRKSNGSIDVNPLDTRDDTLKVRLYAKYGSLFAGYVREASTGETVTSALDGSTSVDIAVGDIMIADKDAQVYPKDKITSVDVVTTMGSRYLKENLANPAEVYTVTTGAIQLKTLSGGQMTYDGVDENAYSGAGHDDANLAANTVRYAATGSRSLALKGNYKVEFRLYTAEGRYENKYGATDSVDTNADGNPDETRYNVAAQTFTVTNSMPMPTVAVTTRTVDVVNDAYIKEVLKTNVDMNNNTSDHESIRRLVKQITKEFCKETACSIDNSGKQFVGYAVVEDRFNYGTEEAPVWVTWEFYVPVNATFGAR